MDALNFFKFIEEKRPEYTWEKTKKKAKEQGGEFPLDKEGGNLLNGKKNGVFVKYDWDTIEDYDNPDDDSDYSDKDVNYLRHKNTYKDGELDGPFVEYSPLGHVIKKGNYKNGNLDGKLITYYPGLIPKIVINYKDGKKNGEQIHYYADGTMEGKMNFVDNVINGEYTSYHTDGNIKYKTNYVDGNRVDKEIFFHPNGQIDTIYNLNSEGQREGPYKTYDSQGRLLSTGQFNSNGSRVGITTQYRSNGKPSSTYNHDTQTRTQYDMDGNVIK